jgi:hypothetical protein
MNRRKGGEANRVLNVWDFAQSNGRVPRQLSDPGVSASGENTLSDDADHS